MFFVNKSSRNGDTDSGFVLGIVFVVVAGYFILTTDNPIRDAVRKKAFDMSIDHVKTMIFGK